MKSIAKLFRWLAFKFDGKKYINLERHSIEKKVDINKFFPPEGKEQLITTGTG